MRVLIVDDNHDAADALATLLEMLGHETQVCHDGHEALTANLQYAPDMVLLDIGLPGMDGYEVARQMLNQGRAVPPFLVALTGYGQSEDKQRSMDAGFAHHLVKPISLVLLEHVLAEALSHHGGAA